MGIHYIGEMHKGSIYLQLCDQISEGQVEWENLGSVFDIVSIGYGDEKRTYPVLRGKRGVEG